MGNIGRFGIVLVYNEESPMKGALRRYVTNLSFLLDPRIMMEREDLPGTVTSICISVSGGSQRKPSFANLRALSNCFTVSVRVQGRL